MLTGVESNVLVILYNGLILGEKENNGLVLRKTMGREFPVTAIAYHCLVIHQGKISFHILRLARFFSTLYEIEMLKQIVNL